MIRTFRLTNEPGGLGLSCTSAGLSLAGVPLLRKTEAGFAPRAGREIDSLLEAALGAEAASTGLRSSLDLIAQALNRGNLTQATIAAALTRTPELSWEAAVRLANAEEKLSKYDADEPRDWHGRWAAANDTGPVGVARPAQEGATRQGADSGKPNLPDSEHGVADGDASPAPANSRVADSSYSDDGTHGADSGEPVSLDEAFESKYDELGPVDFAKGVIEFGDWLAREGSNLSPAERERALAEYAFLQDRLSFWLAYEYKPPTAQLNLVSAALALYQGAVISGIVRPGDLPKSMLDVAGTAWAFGNASAPLRVRPSLEPSIDVELTPSPEPKEVEGLGGTVSNDKVGIKWNKGIKDQGGDGNSGWEGYIGKENPDAKALDPTSKTFDLFEETNGEAISAKTLNTLSVSYIRYPSKILSQLKRYINAAADHEPHFYSDVDPTDIQAKTIHLAIPEYTSPTQWRYLNLAIRYARERGISLEITRIKE